MLKILSADQIRDLDNYTINNEPVSSVDLMERASFAFANHFIKKYPNQSPVYVFCGLGNNGGDGLAIARLLLDRGYSIHVFIVRYSTNTSADFETNFNRLENLTHIDSILESADFPAIPSNSIVIDALFGSGLNRPLEGLASSLIQYLNLSPNCKISVDIPSGLFADTPSASGVIFKANETYCFQIPKSAFFFPENEPYVGRYSILPIGLNEDFINKAKSDYFLTTRDDIQKIIKKRSNFTHKGTYGKALLSVGSYGKVGAAILSASACMRAGIGLLTVHSPKCAYEILQTAIPEVMVLPDEHLHYVSRIPLENNYDAIGLGSGWDTKHETSLALFQLLENYDKPLVIDADALNILSKNQQYLSKIPANSILSPHPKEFERLVGKTDTHFERLKLLREFSREYGVFTILKGYHTAIANPKGNIYFNPTGNAGMATAGSGDVLTGILTSLLAQGYTSQETAILGVYLHGLAGDIAAKKLGKEAMIASDIIENLGKAFLDLQGLSL